MSVSTTPHLNIRGDARKALEFYQSVFGGDVAIATYADIHHGSDGRQVIPQSRSATAEHERGTVALVRRPKRYVTNADMLFSEDHLVPKRDAYRYGPRIVRE
jgi:uncharacterized glyoxalase superfamily protein PhnB